MNIFYVGNFTQQHCTEVHLAATLEDLGHTVIRVQENGLSPDAMTERLTNDQFDLFLFTRTWGNTVQLHHLDILKKRAIPSASYHLDLYVGLQREDTLNGDPFWRTEYVFTVDGDPNSAEVFKQKGINHFYIKPGVFKPECYSATRTNPFGYENDVIFVGGGINYGHPEWPYRRQLVMWLEDQYGERYKKFGYPEETIRNAALNQLYADTKVVIGDSVCVNFTHTHYWSDRVYETIGRGGFIIHPYIKGMEEEFTDKQNIVFYEYGNFDQLRELIDYYLAHDTEREAIRSAGQAYVRENCTYNNRMQQLIETVQREQAK